MGEAVDRLISLARLDVSEYVRVINGKTVRVRAHNRIFEQRGDILKSRKPKSASAKADEGGKMWDGPGKAMGGTLGKPQQKSARDLSIGDRIEGKRVAKLDHTTTLGTVAVFFKGNDGPKADLILNHGDPVHVNENMSQVDDRKRKRS